MNIPDSEKKVLSDFKITIPELKVWKKYDHSTPQVGFFVENGHITKLTLYGLDLTSLPGSIGDLKELRILSLSSNQLKSLPESFQNLINLEILHLSGNKFQTLPDWFGNLIKLRQLNMWGNKLHSIPETIGKLKNLRGIILNDNNISVLPESFRNLNRIRNLELNNAGLRSFSNIPKGFLDGAFEDFEDYLDWECFSSKGNYPSKHAKDELGDDENFFEIWLYYHVSPIELAAKYANDQESLTPLQKDRLSWEGGWRERQLIEAKVKPDNSILSEINKPLIIACDNGMELIK